MYDSKEELGEFFYQEILSYLIEETKQVQESQIVSFFKNQFDNIFFDTVNKKQLAIKTVDYLQNLVAARGNEVLQSDVEKKILSDTEMVLLHKFLKSFNTRKRALFFSEKTCKTVIKYGII